MELGIYLSFPREVVDTLGTTRDATSRVFAKAPRDSSLVEACVELNLGLALALTP